MNPSLRIETLIKMFTISFAVEGPQSSSEPYPFMTRHHLTYLIMIKFSSFIKKV